MSSNQFDGDWQKVQDEESGEYYCWNSVTGENTWTKPAGVFENEEADENTRTTPAVGLENEESAQGGGDTEHNASNDDEINSIVELENAALASGWQPAIDEESGETYYYNDNGEVTWTKPDVLRKLEEALSSEVKPVEESKKVNDTWKKVYNTRYSTYYYYNVHTREQQWAPPEGVDMSSIAMAGTGKPGIVKIFEQLHEDDFQDR